MTSDPASAVDPLKPFVDIGGSGLFNDDPAGVASVLPDAIFSDAPDTPLSDRAFQMLHPDQASYLADLLTGSKSDDSNSGNDGNFNPKAQLDNSQVTQGGIVPFAPGEVAPPPASTVPDHSGVIPDRQVEPESRFDDIGYRFSELFKGHFKNFLNPDRNLPPEIPVTDDQIGFASSERQKPTALKAPASLYSTDPSNWKYVSDDPTRVQRILNVANSMIGHSNAPEDLVRQAYAEAGIDLPAAADFQIEAGDRVPLNKLKPGDIVGWSSGSGRAFDFMDNSGIMLTDGRVIKAGGIGEGPRVFNLYDIPHNQIFGARIRNDSGGGGGTSNSLARSSYVAHDAASAAIHAIQNVLGGLFHDAGGHNNNKSGGNGGGGSHGNPNRSNPGHGAVSGGKRHPRNTGGRGGSSNIHLKGSKASYH